MKIRIQSRHLDVVIQLLNLFFPTAEMRSVAPGGIQIEFPDDLLYRDVVSWFGDAIGCGLVSEYRMIERI